MKETDHSLHLRQSSFITQAISVVLNWGQFCFSAIFGDSFDYHDFEVEDSMGFWNLVNKGWDAVKHLQYSGKSPTTKNYPVLNVNCTKTKKPWFAQRVLQTR